MPTTGTSRRRFLKRSAAAALSAPWIVPASVLGKGGSIAPSNRITLGCIGVGRMGSGNMNSFIGEKDCRVVAVCDVDQKHLHTARDKVNNRYGNNDCVAYRDFRDLLARRDIDAISLATPDHWHAIPAITAAKSGKDIYGEKPLSHSLAEGRAMVDAVTRYGRIWQTGSWQRSFGNFRFACELVRNGHIGKIHTVEVGLPAGRTDPSKTELSTNVTSPPPHLDYEFWVGPAPWNPYIAARCHRFWRWHLDYGGGDLLDWIGHHNDIAHWGLDLDHTGPIEVEGTGEFLHTKIWCHAHQYKVTSRYRSGVTIHMGTSFTMGTKWIGDDGWVFVGRGNMLRAEPNGLLQERIGPNEIHLDPTGPNRRSHQGNFLECVKSRRPTRTPAEVAHRSASPGHLGLIAMKLGRKIRWNPDTEQIIGDDTAANLLANAHRSPWRL